VLRLTNMKDDARGPERKTRERAGVEKAYFDLPGLAEYSSLGISTLRMAIKSESLPCFRLKGKILVRKCEFDKWMEQKYRFDGDRDISAIADEVMESLK